MSIRLKLMSQLLGLAYTCKACEERMPNFICLGWASLCLLIKGLAEGEKVEIYYDNGNFKMGKANQR